MRWKKDYDLKTMINKRGSNLSRENSSKSISTLSRLFALYRLYHTYRFIINLLTRELEIIKIIINVGQRKHLNYEKRRFRFRWYVSINKCAPLKKKKGKRKNRSRKGNIYYATIIKLDVIYTR